jgi:hypothetical protein
MSRANQVRTNGTRFGQSMFSRSETLNLTLGKKKHTTGGIPRWSPTLVLVARFSAYVWQSGRDAQFSLTYGRMYQIDGECDYVTILRRKSS